MREFVRPVAAVFGAACLAACLTVVSTGVALAQAKSVAAQHCPPVQPPRFKQIPLSDRQIEDVIASAKDMDAITEKLPEDAEPDQKAMAQFEAVAKKYGFASYDEYKSVLDNITIVMAGFDPVSKRYVGSEVITYLCSEAAIKKQIVQVQAKEMSGKDKREALAELNQALKAPEPPPVNNKANIDLVTKYYDKLVAVMSDDSELAGKQYH